VHDEFYKQVDTAKKPNVADILTNLKTRVLNSIGIVFSGVIPLHYRPEDSSIWRMATSFGATCFDELTGKVTHLVAANVS
jgi:RNA polymerase II subunit A-like phosphatase